MRATCPAHLIPTDLIILLTCGEEYNIIIMIKSRRSDGQGWLHLRGIITAIKLRIITLAGHEAYMKVEKYIQNLGRKPGRIGPHRRPKLT
jgi:hypothetical protein